MAISAFCVWEVRTTGSQTNGGGYVSGGTDYSQQDTAQLSLTDVVANGTTTLTSATAGFTSAMVGNIIYLEGGSAALTARRLQIITFTNASTIVVDATVPTGTGITGNVGGAVSAPWDLITASIVAGNIMYIKSGTYTTSTTRSFSGWNSPNIDRSARMIGYDTDRSINNRTETNRPIIECSANVALFLNTNCRWYIQNIRFRNTNGTKTSANCFTNQTTGSLYIAINCIFGGASGEGFNNVFHNGSSTATRADGFCNFCEFSYNAIVFNCTSSSGGCSAYQCYIHDNTGDVMAASGTATYTFEESVLVNNTGNAIEYTSGTSPPTLRIANCTIANSSSILIRITTNPTGNSDAKLFIYNNIFYGGTEGLGFSSTGWTDIFGMAVYTNNAFGGQSSAARVNIGAGEAEITLTGDPFVDSSTRNYTLDNTAGEGAACRKAAWMQTMILSQLENEEDLGAYQHQDAGGAGSGGAFTFAY